ncbi:MAG: hypothetical protein MJ215_05120, partial [Spirochaetia bacterium]|nr:hypothetical protein [Spirochaetia bacterium]
MTSGNLDADFFVEETGTVIQAAYSISNISDDRETRALIQAAKDIKDAKRFMIITYDEEKLMNIDGLKIEVIPIWKWLTKNDTLK